MDAGTGQVLDEVSSDAPLVDLQYDAVRDRYLALRWSHLDSEEQVVVVDFSMGSVTPLAVLPGVQFVGGYGGVLDPVRRHFGVSTDLGWLTVNADTGAVLAVSPLPASFPSSLLFVPQ